MCSFLQPIDVESHNCAQIPGGCANEYKLVLTLLMTGSVTKTGKTIDTVSEYDHLWNYTPCQVQIDHHTVL